MSTPKCRCADYEALMERYGRCLEAYEQHLRRWKPTEQAIERAVYEATRPRAYLRKIWYGIGNRLRERFSL